MYCFKQPRFNSKLTKLSRGVRQANISNQDIYNLNIPIPPIELQDRFEVIIVKIEDQKLLLEQSLSELENLFNSLMQQAFKGELFKEEAKQKV